MRPVAFLCTAAAFAGLGPPVGLLITYLVALSFTIYQHGNVGNVLLGFFPIIGLGWLFAFRIGFVPALVSGILIAWAAHLRSGLFLGHVWKRIATCGFIGALVCAIWDPISRHEYVATQTLGTVASNMLFLAFIGGTSSALLGYAILTKEWLGRLLTIVGGDREA